MIGIDKSHPNYTKSDPVVYREGWVGHPSGRNRATRRAAFSKRGQARLRAVEADPVVHQSSVFIDRTTNNRPSPFRRAAAWLKQKIGL